MTGRPPIVIREKLAGLTRTTSCCDAPAQVRYARPYTGTTAPRVTRFSGEARNMMVAATSSTFGQEAWSAFGIARRLAAVSMVEGATDRSKR